MSRFMESAKINTWLDVLQSSFSVELTACARLPESPAKGVAASTVQLFEVLAAVSSVHTTDSDRGIWTRASGVEHQRNVIRHVSSSNALVPADSHGTFPYLEGKSKGEVQHFSVRQTRRRSTQVWPALSRNHIVLRQIYSWGWSLHTNGHILQTVLEFIFTYLIS